jgi:opacity protein-like surface antigen
MKHNKEIIKMKKNILLLLMSLLFFTAAHAQYQESCDEQRFCVENFYAKLLSGVNFLQKSTTDGNKSTFEPGFIVDGLVGYYWSCDLRLEAEYAFRRNAIKKIDFYVEGYSRSGHFQSFSGMANLLWDLPVSSWGCACWNIQPFIGVGLGYDFQQMYSSNSRFIFYQAWNSLSWQTMVGLTCPIFCNADMTLEYKFHQGGRHFYDHYIGIGFVYEFGC